MYLPDNEDLIDDIFFSTLQERELPISAEAEQEQEDAKHQQEEEEVQAAARQMKHEEEMQRSEEESSAREMQDAARMEGGDSSTPTDDHASEASTPARVLEKQKPRHDKPSSSSPSASSSSADRVPPLTPHIRGSAPAFTWTDLGSLVGRAWFELTEVDDLVRSGVERAARDWKPSRVFSASKSALSATYGEARKDQFGKVVPPASHTLSLSVKTQEIQIYIFLGGLLLMMVLVMLTCGAWWKYKPMIQILAEYQVPQPSGAAAHK